MLVLYKKIFMNDKGINNIDTNEEINDHENIKTSLLENIILCSFAFLVIYFGLRPNTLLKQIERKDDSVFVNCNNTSMKAHHYK